MRIVPLAAGQDRCITLPFPRSVFHFIAKTKVASKETVSVAKLELQAALLGTRQADKVFACLMSKIEKRWFWTDSSCVRNWIRSPTAYYKPRTYGTHNRPINRLCRLEKEDQP